MGRASLEWTAEMTALLGTDKDAVLAERWGTSAKTVNLKRNSLGIPAFGHVAWTEDMLAALGTATDAQLAAQWGISKASVVAKRGALGIAPLDASRGKEQQQTWTDAEVLQLGTAPDAQLAVQLGRSAAAVRNARMARGIAPHRPRRSSQGPTPLDPKNL